MPLATIDDLRHARRILVHGVTGSGKSTAAVALGRALDLPVHLVDEEFGWLPGWVQRPAEDMRRLAGAAAAEPAWVFDSSYATFRDLVEPRAELIFGLDYPRWLSLWRLLRRTLARVITRQQVCNGNVENWRALVSRESIILWHFTSFAGKRRQLRQWAACPEGAPVLVLRHPRELDLLLRLLGTE
ncbi:MAG: adenylate kinase [Propionibacterium sp.]|nr:adenylate kinase [Propionibacterium sp.]